MFHIGFAPRLQQALTGSSTRMPTTTTQTTTTPLRGVYLITPQPPAPVRAIVAAGLRGGVRIVQFRIKEGSTTEKYALACELQTLCRQYNALFIINDDIALCQQIGADGIHLGAEDRPLTEARRILGPHAIIGASCYNQIERAQLAQAQGASYVAFGAVYPSPTKPDACRADLALFQQARTSLEVPVCAIGGITPDNAAPLVAAGANLLAVIQGISAAPDPENASHQLCSLFATNL